MFYNLFQQQFMKIGTKTPLSSQHEFISNTVIQNKVRKILMKDFDEREEEQIHYLSLAFKKKLIEINEVVDWRMLADCVRGLILIDVNNTTTVPNEVVWIYVIYGKFYYHEMVYQENQFLSLGQDKDTNRLKFEDGSTYAVLTGPQLDIAKAKRRKRIENIYKYTAKSYIFEDLPIKDRAYTLFWNHVQIQYLKPKQKISIKPDFIYIVMEGSFFIRYQWKRLIQVKEVGPGSIFSHYLGRYFIRKKQDKLKIINFQYFTHQQSVVICFSADLFYQHEKISPYRTVIQKAEKIYEDRVQEAERIIKQVGLMRMEKSQVKKNMISQEEIQALRQKQLQLREKSYSKIFSMSFLKKTNRRKVPNLVNSARNLTEPVKSFSSQTLNAEKSITQIKTERKFQRSETLPLNTKNTIFTQKSLTKSIIDEQKIEQDPNETPLGSRNQFFKPQEFISKKLKIQYEQVMERIKDIEPLTKSIEKRKKFRTEKQYFESFINEERIIKLGPKKRFLYQKKLKKRNL